MDNDNDNYIDGDARSKKTRMIDLKIDLADGCDAVLKLLGQQLDNGNCNSIVRVDVGYFHHHSRRNNDDDDAPASLPNQQQQQQQQQQHYRRRLSKDELNLVFQGLVCCLPKVKTLVIMSYFRADAMSLPVMALEMLFRRAHHLEILFLHQIQLQGSSQEFRIMAQSLEHHPALKRVNLHCCNCGGDDDDNHQISDVTTTTTTTITSLDYLVCGLVKLPTLYYLSLDQVPISELSIRAVAQSTSLRDVSFYNMPQIKSSLPILFQTLRNNHRSSSSRRSPTNDITTRVMRNKRIPNLRGLRIRSCALDHTEAVWIAQMLEHNSSLESVVFYVDSSWDDYGGPLAAALARNTSLKRLEVGIGKNYHPHFGGGPIGGRHNHGVGVDVLGVAVAVDNDAAVAQQHRGNNSGAQQQQHSPSHSTPANPSGDDNTKDTKQHAQAATELAKALENNHKTSLRYFCLNLLHANSNVVYNAYMQPFGTMLESNYILENFLLQGANNVSVIMSPLVGFLLRLNQRSGLNRRKLFQAVVEHDESYNTKVVNDPRQLWVDTLARHADDLSILYYLMCRNPNLVSGALAAPTMGCPA
jgi:hypothetical protein